MSPGRLRVLGRSYRETTGTTEPRLQTGPRRAGAFGPPSQQPTPASIQSRHYLTNFVIRSRRSNILRHPRRHHSSPAEPRSCFEDDRCALSANRRRFEPLVGRLGRRILGTMAARASNSSSRARTPARFASCVRCSRAVRIKIPSCVTRFPAKTLIRRRTSSGNDGDRIKSNRSSTAVETLLTFCPPGPEARTKESAISESGIKNIVTSNHSCCVNHLILAI